MNERIESVIILEKVNTQSGYSNELINSIRNKNLNTNFIRELVYGVVENKILLDYILFSKLDKPNRKLPPKIEEIFRISIFQILFLDNIPKYAIVNEALETAEYFKLNGYKNLLNAILRDIEKGDEEKYLKKIKDRELRIQTEFSLSKDFYDILSKDYSRKTLIKILKSYNAKQEFIIRINKLKSNIVEVKKIFDENGVLYKDHPFLNNSLIIENPGAILNSDYFKNGLFTVQDGGSILVSDVLNPKKNSRVLDLCAAPGSKTCHLSEIMENTGSILANDLYSKKLEKIHENIKRLGCKNIKTISFDATKYISKYYEKFDFILIDAPCSGSGIVSRKPEIKLYRTKEQIRELIDIQRKIVENGFKYLKKGGFLVYSTCSIFEDENENQIKWILDNISNVEISKIDFKNKELDYIKLMPYEFGNNGFFMSKFIKR
ncbi:16S rRNA (cytosine(967)-C(5))-methyltransferase RsmB [Miniphocaeibacter halophilus]|uniref:16S rRNA (Cytosine(967)-C(5))-methyltransferase RsmB n=1 Tax=Miniphocaeibacter halophilus TaxID=2931922 RepID=A0AC61MTU0_9FIRM|nr:16S rRNA (cytosine(967)-C(5))-methyltransferase RsmB [Miniphocaeibacter halophilus]QQK07759.1 16S rRNA (cytosine(967)-C(5))-methyltransferase RsmB [Miniphocaeibacter halophilus]